MYLKDKEDGKLSSLQIFFFLAGNQEYQHIPLAQCALELEEIMNESKHTQRPDSNAAANKDPRTSISSNSTEEEGKLDAAKYSASLTPYQPFPPVINAYQGGSRMRSFVICGKTKSNTIFRVSVHLGFSERGPLGTRPGIYLDNGTSVHDPILAAAGDEDQWSQRYYAFNNNSVILIPRLPGDDDGKPGREWITELMVGSTTGEDEGVVFRFAINAGRDENDLKRERFEWRRFKKGTDPEHPGGGFKLFRLPRPTTRIVENGTQPANHGDKSVVAAADHGCVAVWELSTGLAKYWNHMYTLKFVNAGLSDELDNRWKAMVVVTAARLWMIRLHGKTKKSTISIGEKVKGQSKATT